MFFSMYAESHPSDVAHRYVVGKEYVEVRDGMVCRQLWAFEFGLYWATLNACKSELYGFTDQPEWEDGDGAIDLKEVSADEFEQLWRQAGGP